MGGEVPDCLGDALGGRPRVQLCGAAVNRMSFDGAGDRAILASNHWVWYRRIFVFVCSMYRRVTLLAVLLHAGGCTTLLSHE